MNFRSSGVRPDFRLVVGILILIVLAVLIPVGVGFGIDAEQFVTVFLMLILASQIPYFPALVLALTGMIVFYLPAGIMFGKPKETLKKTS